MSKVMTIKDLSKKTLIQNKSNDSSTPMKINSNETEKVATLQLKSYLNRTCSLLKETADDRDKLIGENQALEEYVEILENENDNLKTALENKGVVEISPEMKALCEANGITNQEYEKIRSEKIEQVKRVKLELLKNRRDRK